MKICLEVVIYLKGVRVCGVGEVCRVKLLCLFVCGVYIMAGGGTLK